MRNRVEWTPQMLKMLTDFFPIMFNKTLCKWIGVSERTMARKASELGLKKVENFTELRKDEYSQKVSEAVKKAYADGRKVSQFKKGVRNNPQGEFKQGFKFEGEIEAERVGNIRRTFKKRKLLSIYGLKPKN